eukprot:Pgem_evm1s16377
MKFLLLPLTVVISQVHAKDYTWISAVEGNECVKTGSVICTRENGKRIFKFPAGEYGINKQVSVPQNTVIEGASNPNNPNNLKERGSGQQTLFTADYTGVVFDTPYCKKVTSAQQVEKMRVGFLLHSNTKVRNVMVNGNDSARPRDNGTLCGGGIFELPGCVRQDCTNDLDTGDGKGASNVVIENVRLNDGNTKGSQSAVWVPTTRGNDPGHSHITINKLVMLTSLADGINFHGKVRDAKVENCYISNTGDDIYAVWGAHYQSTNIVFKNNIAVRPGATRQFKYGVCFATYGLSGKLTIENNICYDTDKGSSRETNPDCYYQCNNSFLAVDTSFQAKYGSGHQISLIGNKYLYASNHNRAITDRPMVLNHAGANLLEQKNSTKSITGGTESQGEIDSPPDTDQSHENCAPTGTDAFWPKSHQGRCCDGSEPVNEHGTMMCRGSGTRHSPKATGQCASKGCTTAYVHGQAFQCNPRCKHYGNCGSDYDAVCGKGSSSTGITCGCKTCTSTANCRCYPDIDWAYKTGLTQHPTWYPGLNARSSKKDIQRHFHSKDGSCPMPC